MKRLSFSGEAIAEGRIGRKLEARDYDTAKRELSKGEHLYAVVHRRSRPDAVYVDEESAFLECLDMCLSGNHPFTLHALKKRDHDEVA